MATRTSKRSETTKTQAQKRKEKEEQDYQDLLNFASESVIGNIFDPQATQGNISYGRLNKKEIHRLLKSPYTNYKQLQNYSRMFMSMEGIYYRVIKTFATMLTYDHVLVPNAESKALEKYKNKLKDCYDTAGLYLEKMNLKCNLPMFAEDFLIDGECYYYEIEDSTGIVYQKIDNDYCLPYRNENGLWRYVIDCMKFATVVDLSIYPLEIQKAMNIYRTSRNLEDNPMFLLERYYPVKNGICFSTVKNGRHGTPPFAFLFKDLIALEQKEELKDKIDKVNNTKMIHNKIETKDKETMVDPKVAKKYNDAIKNNLTLKNLDEGIFTITNPFDAQILNLNTKTAQETNMVTEAIEQLFTKAGLTSNLFNAGNSSEAMKDSIINDSALVINLLLRTFECYVNEKLRNVKTKINMKCVILDTTYYNIENRRTSSLSAMASGGSRTLFMANCGLTPMQSINILQAERLLGIDDLFVPINTSYTQSGNSNEDKGRPNSEDMKSKGKQVSEITDQVNEGK